jgi:hypothetical protein
MPDFATVSDAELREAVRELQRRGHALSYHRRLLHGRIAVLEAELEVRHAARARRPFVI